MDETSAGEGQDCVSIFADMELGRVLFAIEGRGPDTVARFVADLGAHGGAKRREKPLRGRPVPGMIGNDDFSRS